MEKHRFDGFTRQLAKRETRRQAIKTLFAGGMGTAAAVVVGNEADAAKTDCCPVDRPTLCNYTCTDTIYDEANCGDCGVTCAAGQRCYKGICESESIVHCANVAACPGVDTECVKRTCKKGVCGVTYVANGKKTSSQVPGDCQRNVCDGAGNVISIADNTDKPTASSLCTSGVCVNGVPHQNQKPVGAKCPTGKCTAAGTCSGGGCQTATECPPAANECQTSVCRNGSCGYEFATAGTETAQQTQGDCLKNICDGNGTITTVNDDGDVPAPVDSNACTYGVCANGNGAIVNQPAGTACNGGVCDGNGNCGPLPKCFSDIDCQTSTNECVTMACQGGSCIEQYVSYGTPTSFQQPGDCQQDVCDGSGGRTTIPDDGDTTSSTGGGCYDTICSGGNATQLPKPSGSPCDFGICDGNGYCGPLPNCFSDIDCQTSTNECATMTCQGGSCIEQYASYGTPTSFQQYGDCQQNVCDGNGGTTTIPDDSDFTPPYYNTPCIDSICQGGAPSQPPLPWGTRCLDGSGYCDGSGTCVQCLGASDCPGGGPNSYPTCAGGYCSYECDAGWGDCNPGPDGCDTDLMNDEDHCGLCGRACALGQQCSDGTCV